MLIRPGLPRTTMLTVDDLIAMNRRIIQEWLAEHSDGFEGVGANRSLLGDILRETYRKESPVLMAAHLVAHMAWSQPFSGANKRTAVASAAALLKTHGYDLVIKDKEDIEHIRNLLLDVMGQRSALNPSVYDRIILYVSLHTRSL